jgi:hypothetical protein
MERPSDRARAEACGILKGIDQGLRKKFIEIRSQYFNSNTKGYEYEKALSAFLEEYLGGIAEFHTRAALLDRHLKALEVFGRGENEFDVVSTHKTASPKIVLKVGDTKFIPYDGVSFIVEVKQTLSTDSLESDLKKLSKLNDFDCSGRFGISFKAGFSIDRPLKLLFYWEAKADESLLVDALRQNVQSWDMLLIFENDLLIGNRNLPVIGSVVPDTEVLGRFESDSLLQFIAAIQASLTVSPVVNTLPVFFRLMARA